MRMRTLTLVALLGLAACSAREDDDDDDIDFDATDWSAQLSSRASSGLDGDATARSVGITGGAGTSTASVEIRDAAPGSRHPWHVHSGTCEIGGPIVGEAGDYPLLEVGAAGTDEATASISAGMSDEGNYHVNVHRSTGDMTVIACGDLRD